MYFYFIFFAVDCCGEIAVVAQNWWEGFFFPLELAHGRDPGNRLSADVRPWRGSATQPIGDISASVSRGIGDVAPSLEHATVHENCHSTVQNSMRDTPVGVVGGSAALGHAMTPPAGPLFAPTDTATQETLILLVRPVRDDGGADVLFLCWVSADRDWDTGRDWQRPAGTGLDGQSAAATAVRHASISALGESAPVQHPIAGRPSSAKHRRNPVRDFSAPPLLAVLHTLLRTRLSALLRPAVDGATESISPSHQSRPPHSFGIANPAGECCGERKARKAVTSRCRWPEPDPVRSHHACPPACLPTCAHTYVLLGCAAHSDPSPGHCQIQCTVARLHSAHISHCSISIPPPPRLRAAGIRCAAPSSSSPHRVVGQPSSSSSLGPPGESESRPPRGILRAAAPSGLSTWQASVGSTARRRPEGAWLRRWSRMCPSLFDGRESRKTLRWDSTVIRWSASTPPHPRHLHSTPLHSTPLHPTPPHSALLRQHDLCCSRPVTRGHPPRICGWRCVRDDNHRPSTDRCLSCVCNSRCCSPPPRQLLSALICGG